MRSNALPFLLLLAMVWPSLAWLSPAVAQAQAEQIAHLRVHVQEAAHHHDVDASLQLAPEGGSALHFHLDSGVQPLGIATSMAETAVLSAPSALPRARASKPASVFIDALLRPPSLTA
jgi:hypothetical protein